MLRKNFPRRVEKKREQGQERQNKRRGRSKEEQLSVLDNRLGKDKGAKRERLKLIGGIK